VPRREDDGLEKINGEQNELGHRRCCTQVPRVGSIREREEQTLTLIFGSGYHVMNNTCIDMRALGSNIYIYMKGKIYKVLEYRNYVCCNHKPS
jgi:hypothetical protein